jgi:hypothetical protein
MLALPPSQYVADQIRESTSAGNSLNGFVENSGSEY